jgi:hypothetical protein
MLPQETPPVPESPVPKTGWSRLDTAALVTTLLSLVLCFAIGPLMRALHPHSKVHAGWVKLRQATGPLTWFDTGGAPLHADYPYRPGTVGTNRQIPIYTKAEASSRPDEVYRSMSLDTWGHPFVQVVSWKRAETAEWSSGPDGVFAAGGDDVELIALGIAWEDKGLYLRSTTPFLGQWGWQLFQLPIFLVFPYLLVRAWRLRRTHRVGVEVARALVVTSPLLVGIWLACATWPPPAELMGKTLLVPPWVSLAASLSLIPPLLVLLLRHRVPKESEGEPA